MIKSIIRKEILNNLLSYKFSIITILSTILILVSILVMYGDYCLALENYEFLQSKSGESVGVLRPTPLSIFAKGLEDNLCRYRQGSGGSISVAAKQKSVNNLFKLFTTPDLLYVVKIILSLCAMLFAFDMVSGEKEAGTLRQSLSNSLGRPILIMGKWIGGFTSFILPFVMAVLLGTIYVTLSPKVDMNQENSLKLGLFLLNSMIYLAVFFSLGLLISCLTHRSSTSLVVSLFVWATLVFLVPNMGNILARQLVSIPTSAQIELKRQQLSFKNQIEARNENRAERMTWEEQKTSARLRIKRSRLLETQIQEDYRNRFNKLVALSQDITRFSPAATFTFLATDLMGTGLLEERRLRRSVEQHMSIPESKSEEKSGESAFSYQRSSVKEVLSLGGLNNCLVLILFAMLFFTGAYLAFLRYDIR
ncbi:ABC transporter permease [Planctomycetota bacterium]